MGIYDREYMGEPDWRGDGSSRMGRMTAGTPEIVIWIVLANVAVFILQRLLEYFGGSWGYESYGGSTAPSGGLTVSLLQEGQVWRLISYMFVHAHFLHLLGNCLLIFFLGRLLVKEVGRTAFVAVFFLGGIVGAFAEIGFGALFNYTPLLIGASAGALALLFAWATLKPQSEIFMMLYFVVPFRLRAKTLAFIVLGLDVLFFLITLPATMGGNPEGGVAHMAHFGGMGVGFLLARTGTLGRLQGSAEASPKSAATKSNTKERKDKVKYKPRQDNPTIIDANFKGGSKAPSYDQVLDKINQQGIGSLTPQERQILEQASESMNKRKR